MGGKLHKEWTMRIQSWKLSLALTVLAIGLMPVPGWTADQTLGAEWVEGRLFLIWGDPQSGTTEPSIMVRKLVDASEPSVLRLGETTTFPCLWNLCLAARAEGLGTAITSLLKLQKERVEDLLGMPKGDVWNMHGMIPIGYPTGTWLRNPAGSAHTPFSKEGTLIYVKTGHL